jgi:hypothetical protein
MAAVARLFGEKRVLADLRVAGGTRMTESKTGTRRSGEGGTAAAATGTGMMRPAGAVNTRSGRETMTDRLARGGAGVGAGAGTRQPTKITRHAAAATGRETAKLMQISPPRSPLQQQVLTERQCSSSLRPWCSSSSSSQPKIGTPQSAVVSTVKMMPSSRMLIKLPSFTCSRKALPC